MSAQPPLRELVLQKVRDGFADPYLAAKALNLVERYGSQPWHRERERVQLAVLMQCHGDINRLSQLVALADRDFRDAIVGAEFPEEFQASSRASTSELAAIRRRDRAQYEAWLKSNGT